MGKAKIAEQAADEFSEMEAANAFPQDFENLSKPDPDANPRPEPKKTKTEKLLIPLDPNGTSDAVFICVNGRNMLVKRGEPVDIPAEFAEAYRNAQAQQLAAVKAQKAAMSTE